MADSLWNRLKKANKKRVARRRKEDAEAFNVFKEIVKKVAHVSSTPGKVEQLTNEKDQVLEKITDPVLRAKIENEYNEKILAAVKEQKTPTAKTPPLHPPSPSQPPQPPKWFDPKKS